MKNRIERKNTSLKKKKQNQANLDESSTLGLISQTCNPWNPKLGLNQEAQFPSNLILKDEIRKNQFRKFYKVKKIAIKWMKIKFDREIKKKDEIIKKKFNLKNYLK